jgi:hypothetical protein
MSLSNNYDWIVLGDHPGALLSANLVAKLGLSVLVLPNSATQKVVFSQSGQCLDPEPNFMSGLAEGGLLYEILKKAAVSPSEGEVNATDAFAQALTPERRLSLSSNPEMAIQELDRELTDGVEKTQIEQGLKSAYDVSNYWREFPGRLTLNQTGKKTPKEVPANWDDLIKRLQGKKGKVRSDLLAALAYGATGQVSDGWSSGEWVHSLALGQSGASFRGGMSAYRRMLLRAAKKQGVTVLEDVECRRIFVTNRKFIGVQVSVSGNMIAGTGCILGSTLLDYSDKISFTGPRWFARKVKPPKPVGWRFTIALTVREEAIVPGLSRRMIWKETHAPVLEIEVADPSEYGTKEPDHKLIFLRTVLPFNRESLSPAYQRTIAARMFRVATEIIPFLEYHVIRVYPNFRSAAATAQSTVGAGDELSEIYGFPLPQLIPENIRVYEGGANRSLSGIEGLFIAAGESFPKLGSLGPTIAALEATAWVAHRSGLPGPFA